jgi:hypothetical protein
VSHYYCLAVLPPGTENIVEAIDELMAPHVEGYDEAADELSGWWDWYQIGGRWTGVLDGYDPSADPRNSEVCYLCHGTGTRTDMVVANGCNGCAGTGIKEKWPTDWAKHPGDIARLGDVRAKIAEDARPYRVIGPEIMAVVETYNPEGTHYDDEPYETAKFQRHPQVVLDAIDSLYDDCIVVVVDYHN